MEGCENCIIYGVLPVTLINCRRLQSHTYEKSFESKKRKSKKRLKTKRKTRDKYKGQQLAEKEREKMEAEAKEAGDAAKVKQTEALKKKGIRSRYAKGSSTY